MNTKWVKPIHSLPGRLRLQVTGLKGNKVLAKLLEQTFNRAEHIYKFEANPLTGKVLIFFDVKNISQQKVCFLLNKVLDAIATKINVFEAKNTCNYGCKAKEDIFEPEDMPLETQMAQVVGTGVVLVGMLLKRFLWGKSLAVHSPRIHTLAAATTIISGYPILRSGLEGLFFKKKLNNDFLISAATLVSLVMKESITGLVVVWLVNLSTLFQTLTLRKSRNAIRDMLQGGEKNAWIEVDGTLVSVPIESLEKDNIVACHIGEKIPVDGEVVCGEAAISQAIITGESIPITKKAGDQVFAGSIVEQGQIRIKAEKVGNDTSLAKIIYLVEEASEVRAPIENIADRYSEKIVPWSFGLAGLTYLLTRDFRRTMTMLIVACPCAAGLATPTAISAAIGNAAKKGILIKGGSYLENVGKTNVVLFDKTGTLTEGKPIVKEVITLQKEFDNKKIIQIAASLEAQTSHPLANAVVSYAEQQTIPLLDVTEKEVIVGRGLKGKINDKTILVGNEQFMSENGINVKRGKVKSYKLSLLGQTIIYVAEENSLAGIIGVCDKLRDESSQAIKELRFQGIDKIGLITGDCNDTGEAVSKELGMDMLWCETLPEDKLRIVEQFQKENSIVTMVGEGINDSPALAKADVGIAMGTGGTDVAIETADIVLANDNPIKVAEVIRLSNRTMEVVKQNFAFAVGINAIGLMLGAAKFISPLAAAILHNLSTFGVVINSSRLLNYKDRKKGRKRFAGNQGIGRKAKAHNESA